MAEIALLPATSSEDDVIVAEVCDLVNSAYVLAEQGMWHAGVARTTVAETAEAISRKELVAARGHGQLVGAIRSRQLDPCTGWFGALAVDVAHGGQGVGAQLVAFAEAQARSNGASTMQLELLVPLHVHPHTRGSRPGMAAGDTERCGAAGLPRSSPMRSRSPPWRSR